MRILFALSPSYILRGCKSEPKRTEPKAEKGFPFNLYFIDIDGKRLKRVTHGETCYAFPVFSKDAKYLASSSNRNNSGTRDTNRFIAACQAVSPNLFKEGE